MQRERKLTNFLIAKTVIEIIFVIILAAYFSYADFSPGFRGWLDIADEREISGWVVNGRATSSPVEVQLYIDNRFVANNFADRPRPDLVRAGRAESEHHGFAFETPPLNAGEHEARVFAVHASRGGVRRTLQLIGAPLRFRVEAERNARTPTAQSMEDER